MYKGTQNDQFEFERGSQVLRTGKSNASVPCYVFHFVLISNFHRHSTSTFPEQWKHVHVFLPKSSKHLKVHVGKILETLRGNGSLRKELKAQNTFKDVIGVLVDLESLGSADVVRNEASWCSRYVECVDVVFVLLVPGGEYVRIFASFIFTP